MPQSFGKIVKKDGDLVTIQITQAEQLKYLLAGSKAGLIYDDGRHITADQQRKVYALLGEIDRWSGNYMPNVTKRQMKRQYIIHTGLYDGFSLADCSMSVASNFIEFLIEFCLSWNVPFASRTVDQLQGQYGWERSCLKFKKCCICGKHADVAHVHAVGIGRDRNHIHNVGNAVMPLCRVHHNEQHTRGIYSFMAKYHIKGVRVTPEISEMLRIGDWRTEQGESIISTNYDTSND